MRPLCGREGSRAAEKQNNDLASGINAPIIVVPPVEERGTEARKENRPGNLHLGAQHVGEWHINLVPNGVHRVRQSPGTPACFRR